MDIRVMQVGPLQTNCYMISCPETREVAVIDPGWSGSEIYQAIAESTLTLKAILLTHAHFDHVGGVAELKRLSNAPIYVHPDAAEMLSQAHLYAEAWGLEIEAVPIADYPLTEAVDIQIGNAEVRVLHTPGHAPGHVSFYMPAEGAVFDGDVLFKDSIGRYDLPGGDFYILMRSIREQLLKLPDETTVYAGHGLPTTIGKERQFNIYLRD